MGLFVRTMFFAGCLALPWLWVVNVWYFFPTVFRSNGDGSPELTKCKQLVPIPRHPGPVVVGLLTASDWIDDTAILLRQG